MKLLERPIPFVAVAAAADIRPGSHAPTDLLKHAARLRDDEP